MAAKRSKRKHLRSALFVGISTLIILVGGSVTMLWQLNQTQGIRAAGNNIIGSPSLPAATVDAILRRMGSPMAGSGKIIEQASRATNIDDAFALGVWWTETNDGEAGVGLADRNPGSVRGSAGYPAAFDGYTIYPSYAAAEIDWFNLLRSRYVSRGLTSVYAICHPYVGTSSAALWAGKVVNLMVRYRGEAPPPTSQPTIITTPTQPPLSPRNHRLIINDNSSAQVTSTTKNAQTTFPRAIENSAPIVSIKSQQVGALPVSKTLPVGLGLLSALVIGLWGLKIRSSALPVPGLADAATGAIPAYPPLYVNQYSPVLEPQPSPILREVAERQTDQLALAEVKQLSFPGLSPWIPTEQAPELATAGAGLLSRYHNAEEAAHRIILQPADSNNRLFIQGDENGRNPTTEALPPRGMNLPGRQPELVSNRPGGGLLRRYGGQQ